MGVPVPAGSSRFGEAAGGWVHITGGGGESAAHVLNRLGPGGGRATITLAEFVDEYLEMHQAARVTVAKLRWLLGKATAVLAEKRVADLSPREVYPWRFSVPKGAPL